jgi:hypothetical protein
MRTQNIRQQSKNPSVISPSRYLQAHSPYVFIPYSPARPPLHSSTLTVLHPSTYTYSGPLIAHTLPPALCTWAYQTFSSPSTLLSLLKHLLSFLQTFLKSAGVECYCLSIRATHATHDYDEPRWHVDEDFFESWREGNRKAKKEELNKRWKLCTTLLGPRTLFISSCDHASALKALRRSRREEKEKHAHICTSIRCLGCATYSAELRHILVQKLAGHKTMAPEANEVAVFKLGDDEGAVHSEPKCDSDRVFVNVVPGTEEELRELMQAWGMPEWPREWSVHGEM